jgi:hypothetical protein
MVKFISKHILTGLITILPVVLTFYLLYWFVVSAESVLGDMIRLWLPEGRYWPGMGLIAGLLAAFITGLLMHAYVVQRLFAAGEKLFYHTPVIKTIYQALRDFLNYFSPSTKKEFDQVVAVTLGDTGMQVVGFVTQADPESLPRLRHPGRPGKPAGRFSRRRQRAGLSALELHDWWLCRANTTGCCPTTRHEHGGGDALYPDCRRHRPKGKVINQSQATSCWVHL